MISFHRMYRLVLQIRYVQVGKCEIFCIFWTMRKPILKFETYSMVIYFKVLRVQTNAYPDRINSRQIPHLLIQFLLQTYNRVRCELTNSLAFIFLSRVFVQAAIRWLRFTFDTVATGG